MSRKMVSLLGAGLLSVALVGCVATTPRTRYYDDAYYQRRAQYDCSRCGVIRDVAVQDAVLVGIRDFALAGLPGARLVGTMDSPITGTDGNREFLLGLRKEPPHAAPRT